MSGFTLVTKRFKFFLVLEAAGFVGCVETDLRFASRYKSRLDFWDMRSARQPTQGVCGE